LNIQNSSLRNNIDKKRRKKGILAKVEEEALLNFFIDIKSYGFQLNMGQLKERVGLYIVNYSFSI